VADSSDSESDAPKKAVDKKKNKKPVVDSSDSESDAPKKVVDTKKKKTKADSSDSDSDAPKKVDVKKKKTKKKVADSSDSESDAPKKVVDKKKKKNKEEVPDFGKKKSVKKDKPKALPLVGEVLDMSPIPKKDKLQLCTVSIGDQTVSLVTNAPNVKVGKKFVVALPGVTTADGIAVVPRKVGGVESAGMFCGPGQLGWETDELNADHAVMAADGAKPGSPAPALEEVLAVQAAIKEEERKAKEKDTKGKKGKKKAKEDDDGFDALISEFKVEETPQETAGAKAGKKDKKKAGKAAAKLEDDIDFDSALQEAQVARKDEAKSTQDVVAKVEETPVEALVAPAAAAAPPAPVAKAPVEAELDAKTLANRRKKEKKKARTAGGDGLWGGDESKPTEEAPLDAAVAPAPAPAPAPAAKAGAKGKKESAVVKAARERLEAERALEEERRLFEEEQRRVIAEQERIEREKEEAEAAERKRKRDARLAKIEKQKEDGTYLTKKAKEQAKRAAELREMFGVSDDKKDEEEDGVDKKAQMLESMKKKKKKQVQKVEVTVEEGAEETKTQEEGPTTQEEAAVEDDVEDEWEILADAKEEEAEEEEEEEGSDSDDSDDFLGYRSPIVCIMGHVDTGKTKLLDKIRGTNVQDGEAGGITQQIGATFFPDLALAEQTMKVNKDFDIEVPGLLIIDTPGHESFANLRNRGSSLCDIAILVIDIMHRLQPQTVESLELLKKRRCPFVIALNKVDRMHCWEKREYAAIQPTLALQQDMVTGEFYKRWAEIKLELAERGLNTDLYWENDTPENVVSVIPTSALNGEGVPDLLYMLLHLSQTVMPDKLEVEEDLNCTVIEVKNVEGLGTTIDVILINGRLSEGDQIVIAGMGGAIVTTVRALLTPHPLKEIRVKAEYVHHQSINKSMGIKICAPGLDAAMAGSDLLVVGPDDDIEELKEEVQEGFDSILLDYDKQTEGVYVKASTLGSLEALLSFLQDMKIPVFDMGIGEVHKKDVKKAMIMTEKKHPEYAVILAFDVKVSPEARKQGEADGVQIFTADIIYHLEERFRTYMAKVLESQKTESRAEAVFPVVLKIDSNCIFRKKDPMIFGCDVLSGQLRVGTPLCLPDKDCLEIGRVGSIEINRKPVEKAKQGDKVCIKIEATTAQGHIAYGRHFDHSSQLVSLITRSSIDVLKERFKDEMAKSDWELVIGLKKVFNIT